MGRRMKVGVTNDGIPGIELLDELSNVKYRQFSAFVPEITPDHIRGFDMVVTAKPRWTQESVADSEDLVCVLYLGMGFDHISVAALTGADVMLCNSPQAVRRPMGVTILTFILALAMRLLDKDRITRQGKWEEKDDYNGIGLQGRTLGLIGAGNIGHEVFALARPRGMRHIACDPYVDPGAVADVDVTLVDMDRVLAESDFLVISVPLNEETRHLVGAAELRQMKRTAFLINGARGAVVDEAALIEALQQGRLRGAGLDVFEEEPTPVDNPLLHMGNVVVAPHCLCETDELFRGMWEQKVGQIREIARGETPSDLVNPEVLEKPGFQTKLARFHEATG